MHILTKQELYEKALPALRKIFTEQPNKSVNVHDAFYPCEVSNPEYAYISHIECLKVSLLYLRGNPSGRKTCPG